MPIDRGAELSSGFGWPSEENREEDEQDIVIYDELLLSYLA